MKFNALWKMAIWLRFILVSDKIRTIQIMPLYIFRFEEDKVVELWDFAQVTPAEMINEIRMFNSILKDNIVRQ